MNEDDSEILSPQVASGLLRSPRIGRDLRAAFPAIAPPQLTRGTVRALVHYLEHRDCVRPESIVHDITDSHPGTVLRGRWIAEGGSEDELVKFVTMGEFRIRTLRAASWLQDLKPDASGELEAFWVTGGHDMTELRRYLSEVDAEVGDWLPK